MSKVAKNTLQIIQNKIIRFILNERKSVGPDGVSDWVLKECKQQLAGKLSDLIKMYIKIMDTRKKKEKENYKQKKNRI